MPTQQGDKHHYIPKFYLKQWVNRADPKRKLCEFSRPYKTVVPRRTDPDGTGYERGLYSFANLPAPAADMVEKKLLLRSDDFASRALQRMLVDDLNFDQDTKSAWSRFLMSLFHRNPERIAYLRNQINEDYPRYIASIREKYEVIRDPQNPRTYDEFEASVGIADKERMNLRLLMMIMNSESVGFELNNMVWGVIQFPHLRHSLLTSDRPLVMTNGIKHDNSFIILPIAPDRIFFAARSRNVANRIAELCKNESTAIKLNDRIVSQAHRYVYGRDDKQMRFVVNRFGQKLLSTPMFE
jgi:hypothetical protein